MKLTHNIGTIDRVIRVIAGLGLISLVFVGPQTLWGWLGLLPLATAAISFCPLYALLGMNTCSTKPVKETKKYA